MAFFWRIWLAVSAVSLVVLATFIILASLQFAGIHSSLVGERLTLLAARTAAPFEQAARIGLGLATVRAAEGLLERARQTDDAIIAIHVFDVDGRILRSTDLTPPATVPPAARAARTASRSGFWHAADGAQFLSGAEIASRNGTSVGGVLIAYSAAQNTARVGAMATELILAGIVVLIGAVGLGALLLRIGLRRQIRAFDALESAIEGFEHDSWRTAAAAPRRAGNQAGDREDDRDGNDMRAMLDMAEARYRAAGHALAEAARR